MEWFHGTFISGNSASTGFLAQKYRGIIQLKYVFADIN